MDYNRNNNNVYRRNTGNTERRAQSIQDILSTPAGGQDSFVTKQKSSYSGPKTKGGYYDSPSPAQGSMRSSSGGYGNSTRDRNMAAKGGSYNAPESFGTIDQIAGIVFTSILCLCLIISIISFSAKLREGTFSYPLNVVTINGLLNDIYEDNFSGASSGGSYSQGGLGSDTGVSLAQTATVTGASMLLDAGGGVVGYGPVTDYTELLGQLDGAMAAGDYVFVGAKIGYTDENGSLMGYPQSVVEHFTTYMAANPDKRQGFIDMVKNADKYMATNGTALIVNLPLIKYRVTTDYAQTSFTFSGFAEQTINASQEATISPMLPCMYNVVATCPDWAKPVEGTLEATFGENLEVNFGSN